MPTSFEDLKILKVAEDIAETKAYTVPLTEMARQLNLFIASLKGQRSGEITVAKTLRDHPAEYAARLPDDFPNVLFDETDLAWLES